MRVSVIVQARMGSTRLPGKSMMDVGGKPLVWHVLDRARHIGGVDDVVLATTELPEDRQLVELAQSCGVPHYAGSEEDVLDRYYRAARQWRSDTVIRVTADCPLLDPFVSQRVLEAFRASAADYASNPLPPTFPHGLDTEVVSFAALEQSWREGRLKTEREHVTQYIRRRPDQFRMVNVRSEKDRSSLRWTVDHREDLEFVRQVVEGLARRGWPGYHHEEVLRVVTEDGLRDASDRFQRAEGLRRTMKEDGLSGELA